MDFIVEVVLLILLGGGGGTERARGGTERERTSGLLQSVRVCFWFLVFTYFVLCNGSCARKEKWHRKEHIIIIIRLRAVRLVDEREEYDQRDFLTCAISSCW